MNWNNTTSIGSDIMSEWVKVCKKDQLNDGDMLPFDYKDKKILIANKGDKIYATGLICTHAEADLSTGFMTDEGVRCPLHLSVFDLETGEPQNPPAETPLQTYNVKIEQDEIYVEV